MGPITHTWGGGNVHTGAIELIHNLLSGLCIITVNILKFNILEK